MGKNGGARPGAGRKSKADEIQLIEKLDAYFTPDDFARELGQLIQKSTGKTKLDAMRLYADYRMGRPTQHVTGDMSFTLPPLQWHE